MDWNDLSKFVLSPIRGGMFQYILIENGYRYGSSCYNVFSYKFLIPPLKFLSLIYIIFPSHHSPTRGKQIAPVDSCPIHSLMKSLGVTARLKKHNSDITSSLMQLGSQLQNIQCGCSSFPLDISKLSSLLYVHDECPYH